MTDFAAARRSMVEHQLRPRGIRDERVLAAMGRVPREAFVPESIAHEAYLDCALPIDCEQTISQPIIVAMMTEALRLTGYRSPHAPREESISRSEMPTRKVLEIGTGSGYQSAILAELAAAVYSIERHAELARQAESRLHGLGYRNVFIRADDGSLGWPEEAPFDRIIVTAAAEECPPALWDQLIEGGILVGPFGPAAEQALYETHKIGGQPQSRILTGCRFVPLIANAK
jgi:protein-L-isoaspartate(D-aspartate) O-methyltransferase